MLELSEDIHQTSKVENISENTTKSNAIYFSKNDNFSCISENNFPKS